MAKAYKQVWKSITGVPAENFAGKRYTFVTYNSEGKIIPAAAGGIAIGVLEEPNDVDQPAQVVAQGFMFVKLGAALEPGVEVQVGDNGTAVALADGKSVGILHVGGTAGSIGTVLLK